MKSFENYIKSLLDKEACKDICFAKDYKRADKSISECAALIVEALRNGCNGHDSFCFPSNEQLIGWAIHYYHEENLTAKDFDTSIVEYSKVTRTPDNKADNKKAKTKKPVPVKAKQTAVKTLPESIPEEEESFDDFEL